MNDKNKVTKRKTVNCWTDLDKAKEMIKYLRKIERRLCQELNKIDKGNSQLKAAFAQAYCLMLEIAVKGNGIPPALESAYDKVKANYYLHFPKEVSTNSPVPEPAIETVKIETPKTQPVDEEGFEVKCIVSASDLKTAELSELKTGDIYMATGVSFSEKIGLCYELSGLQDFLYACTMFVEL